MNKRFAKLEYLIIFQKILLYLSWTF